MRPARLTALLVAGAATLALLGFWRATRPPSRRIVPIEATVEIGDLDQLEARLVWAAETRRAWEELARWHAGVAELCGHVQHAAMARRVE